MGDWVKHLEDGLEAPKLLQPKGEGWKTMREIIEECDWGVNKTRRMVNEGVKAGTIKVFSGTEMNASGIKCRQHWYKIK